MYLTEQSGSIDLDSIWNEYSSNNRLVAHVRVLAQDNEGAHTSSVRVRLDFIRFVEPTQVVIFDATPTPQQNNEKRASSSFFYEFSVVESIGAYETIGYVNSARFLEPTNSTNLIIYEIIDGDDDYEVFRIDYLTGRLYTRSGVKQLDYEAKPNYTLIIRARPSMLDASPATFANATVFITLVDCNDNPPQFDLFEYNTTITDDKNDNAWTSPMSKIFQMRAHDLDSPGSVNSQVRYKLLNQLDLFYVHERTGWVYNKQAFVSTASNSGDSSISSSDEYLLKIQAYDIGSVFAWEERTWKAKSLSSVAHLRVGVRAGNTQRPQFDKSLYTAHVDLTPRRTSSSITQQFVSKLSAKDTDLDESAAATQLVYSIRSQPWPHDLFSIDSLTGVVTLDVPRFGAYMQATSTTSVNVFVATFSLVVAVTDGVFTSVTRLSVQVKSSPIFDGNHRTIRFISDRIRINLGKFFLSYKSVFFAEIFNFHFFKRWTKAKTRLIYASIF